MFSFRLGYPIVPFRAFHFGCRRGRLFVSLSIASAVFGRYVDSAPLVGSLGTHPGALGRPSSSSWGESSSTLPLRHTFSLVPFHRTPPYGVVLPWSFPRILRTFSKHRDGVASSWTVHWSGGSVHVSSLFFPPTIHPFGASLLPERR